MRMTKERKIPLNSLSTRWMSRQEPDRALNDADNMLLDFFERCDDMGFSRCQIEINVRIRDHLSPPPLEPGPEDLDHIELASCLGNEERSQIRTKHCLRYHLGSMSRVVIQHQNCTSVWDSILHF